MGYAKELERSTKERIVNDLANHVVTAKRVDGLYRHYRCQRPGTWSMGFDVVTWPGSLCFTGDMGDYLFQRTSDMVAFMRGSCMSYSYAAEKCVAHDGRLKEFRREVFEEILNDYVTDHGLEEADNLAEIHEKIAAARAQADGVYESPHEAMAALYESGLWDGCDLPSCETWTFHFLWCLHAINWFCEQIDAGRVQQAA